MTFCQLFGLEQWGRVGSIVGLGVSTTSWNIGTADLMWFEMPSEQHPFIAQNLYRLKNNKFEQIGQAWAKHGFFALSNTQCGGTCTYEPGHGLGSWLGMGCTDTYSSFLNANPNYLGPRYEINPWTGGWTYAGSHFTQGQTHTAISHRLQVHDSDLNPALNAGAQYFIEGYYVISDDVNVMNSAAWKPVTITGGSPGSVWTFSTSSSGTVPNTGFAINAWSGATQTVFAQDVPPIEFVSPDGRCVLAGKAIALPNHFWRYEFALLNIDMDRQVGSLSIPISFSTTVRNIEFHAVQSHDEPVNGVGGVPIDNSPWVSSVSASAITFDTTTNPLRWGTLYNFSFEANVPPVLNANVTLGLFKPGTPSQLTYPAFGPSPSHPDCNGNMVPDYQDIPGTSPDCDGNNIPDECDPNCDSLGLPDACVILTCPPNTPSCADCNGNAIPDGCDISSAQSLDCNGNGVPDECEISTGSPAPGGPFYCVSGCDPDCNENGIPDFCDIASELEVDCDSNQVPDSCQIDANPGLDCNLNGKLDVCGELDCNANMIPDDCELPVCAGIVRGDLDCSGVVDMDDIPDFIEGVLRGVPSCLIDMNQDSLSDGRDLHAFTDELVN